MASKNITVKVDKQAQAGESITIQVTKPGGVLDTPITVVTDANGQAAKTYTNAPRRLFGYGEH